MKKESRSKSSQKLMHDLSQMGREFKKKWIDSWKGNGTTWDFQIRTQTIAFPCLLEMKEDEEFGCLWHMAAAILPKKASDEVKLAIQEN